MPKNPTTKIIERLMRVEYWLCGGGDRTPISRLAAECNVDRKTIENDIQTLRELGLIIRSEKCGLGTYRGRGYYHAGEEEPIFTATIRDLRLPD